MCRFSIYIKKIDEEYGMVYYYLERDDQLFVESKLCLIESKIQTTNNGQVVYKAIDIAPPYFYFFIEQAYKVQINTMFKFSMHRYKVNEIKFEFGISF